jgi:hypothetical protein
MDDHIEFLLEAAQEIRQVALSAPEIAADLRRMADELEAAAIDLRRASGASVSADFGQQFFRGFSGHRRYPVSVSKV